MFVQLKSAMPAAFGVMALRGGIVGVNFLIMIGLAGWLGLAAFGALLATWAMALVIAPVVSVGGALLVLRGLTGREPMSHRALITYVTIFPGVLAVMVALLGGAFWPAHDWAEVAACAFLINLLTCLASIMRALGSVNLSMALRDSGPYVALGLGAVTASGGQVLWQAAALMVLMAVTATIWIWLHPKRAMIFGKKGIFPRFPTGLWGTSVLGVALAQVDIVIGAGLLTPTQLGLYVVMRRVANLVALPVSVATWVSANDIAKSRDAASLQAASDAGNRVAFMPGVALFLLALAALPWCAAQGWLAFFVLLTGAMTQVLFASSLTVATLQGLEHVAMVSRALSLAVYCLLSLAIVGPATNALSYVTATSIGCIFLWYVVRVRLGVDSAASALMNGRGARWNLS